MNDIKIKIRNLNGETTEIIVDKNSTIERLKEAYVKEKARKKEGEPEYTEKDKAVLETKYNLHFVLGTRKLPDDKKLKELLKCDELKDEITITAIIRSQEITDCLKDINKLNSTSSQIQKLTKIKEILKIEIDSANGTPIFASSDKEIVLAAMQQNGDALQYASKELKADTEFMLAAVKQNGPSLWYASEELKDDREIVLAAVQQDVSALQFASEILKADNLFILEALQQDGLALAYASEKLKNNDEIVSAAVQKNNAALAYAPEELKAEIVKSSPLQGLKSTSIMPTRDKASISNSSSSSSSEVKPSSILSKLNLKK
jgi:hypothetical protein